MTTYVAFQPQPNVVFQFQATLDGNLYTISLTWNVYGQRYYVNVYDTQNNWIVTIALIGSPPNYNINILGGYFTTSTLVYRVSTGNFEITP
jgi:uncharacterized protein DUF6983